MMMNNWLKYFSNHMWKVWKVNTTFLFMTLLFLLIWDFILWYFLPHLPQQDFMLFFPCYLYCYLYIYFL